MVVSNLALMTVVQLAIALKAVLSNVSKAVQTTALTIAVATRSSHVKAHRVATLEKAMAHHAVISVHRVTSTIVPLAALRIVHPHAVHVRRLKQVARRLTSLLAQRVVNHLAAVLMPKNVRRSHVPCVN